MPNSLPQREQNSHLGSATDEERSAALSREILTTAVEVHAFCWLRFKDSHRIYAKGGRRVVVPFHMSATLRAKIVRQVLEAIDEGSIQPA